MFIVAACLALACSPHTHVPELQLRMLMREPRDLHRRFSTREVLMKRAGKQLGHELTTSGRQITVEKLLITQSRHFNVALYHWRSARRSFTVRLSVLRVLCGIAFNCRTLYMGVCA